MCCLSSPEGSRSGKATTQMTCQQETLYSDNRKGAAQVQHIAYAIVSPVSPPGKQVVAIKTRLFQVTKKNPSCLSCPSGLSSVSAECASFLHGTVLWSRLSIQEPMSCSAYLRIHRKTFPLHAGAHGCSPAACTMHLEEDCNLSLCLSHCACDFCTPGNAFIF